MRQRDIRDGVMYSVTGLSFAFLPLGKGLERIQCLVPEPTDALDILSDLHQALWVGEMVFHLAPFGGRCYEPGFPEHAQVP